MGIRFNHTTKSDIERSTEELPIECLSGKKIAIDVSFIIRAIKLHSRKMHIDQGNFNIWYGLLFFTNHLLKYGVVPYYVFEGTNDFKQGKENVLNKRREARHLKFIMRDHFNYLLDFVNGKHDDVSVIDETNKIISFMKMKNDNAYTHLEYVISNKKPSEWLIDFVDYLNNTVLDGYYYENELCSVLFDYLGINYIFAKGDAENECVEMCKSKLVDVILTPDADVLMMGCDQLRFDPNETLQPFHFNFTSYDKLKEKIKLTDNQIMCYFLLQGCDLLDKKNNIAHSYFIKNDLEKCIDLVYGREHLDKFVKIFFENKKIGSSKNILTKISGSERKINYVHTNNLKFEITHENVTHVFDYDHESLEPLFSTPVPFNRYFKYTIDCITQERIIQREIKSYHKISNQFIIKNDNSENHFDLTNVNRSNLVISSTVNKITNKYFLLLEKYQLNLINYKKIH